MNLQETVALLEALRASGVTRFKSQEHDIELNGQATIGQKQIASILDQKSADAPLDPTPKETEEATNKLKEMIRTMNMTPDQMAKYMFPEEAP